MQTRTKWNAGKHKARGGRTLGKAKRVRVKRKLATAKALVPTMETFIAARPDAGPPCNVFATPIKSDTKHRARCSRCWALGKNRPAQNDVSWAHFYAGSWKRAKRKLCASHTAKKLSGFGA